MTMDDTGPTWAEVRARWSAVYAGRKTTVVSKHRALNGAHLKALLDRLDAEGDAEAADTITWMMWWRDLDSNRERFLNNHHYEALAESIGDTLQPPDAERNGQ